MQQTPQFDFETRSYKDYLTNQLNNFQNTAIGNALDLKRHLIIKDIDPSFKKLVPQGPGQQPKTETIDEMILRFREGLGNALEYLKGIKELISDCETGEAQINISLKNLSKIPSPLNEEMNEVSKDTVDGPEVEVEVESEEPVEAVEKPEGEE